MSARTVCRLGSNRRGPTLWAWDTVRPTTGPLPQISHRFAINPLLASPRNACDVPTRVGRQTLNCSRSTAGSADSPASAGSLGPAACDRRTWSSRAMSATYAVVGPVGLPSSRRAPCSMARSTIAASASETVPPCSRIWLEQRRQLGRQPLRRQSTLACARRSRRARPSRASRPPRQRPARRRRRRAALNPSGVWRAMADVEQEEQLILPLGEVTDRSAAAPRRPFLLPLDLRRRVLARGGQMRAVVGTVDLDEALGAAAHGADRLAERRARAPTLTLPAGRTGHLPSFAHAASPS